MGRPVLHLLTALLGASLLLSVAEVSAFLNSNNQNIQLLARWCCLNQAEYVKCQDWSLAANVTGHKALNSSVVLECVLGTDKYDCFRKIFEDKADLMTADAGEVYTAGKFYNLIPIATESYFSPQASTYSDYFSVAVVRRGSTLSQGGIGALRGSNSCHGGVGLSSGWNMPISTLIEKQLLEIVDCNNHVKAAAKFFNKMCAPDALNTQFNPTGDNPTSACDLCRGKIGTNFCTNQDPYAGPLGAMLCLTEGGGDVAFVKHTTLYELAATNSSININDYELLCPNVYGSPFNSPGLNVQQMYPTPTAPISDYKLCNWGVVPARAVLTSSRKALVQRLNYRRFLDASAQLFAGQAPYGSGVASGVLNGQVPMNSNREFVPHSSFQIAAEGAEWEHSGHQATTTPNPFNYNFNPTAFNEFSAGLKENTSDAFFSSELYHQQRQLFNSGAYRFYMFESKTYGARDLVFTDSAVSFIHLDDKTTFLSFLRKLKFTFF
jgi:melanoma-associated antigen p97